MRILFLTPQLPYPPRQGTTLRNYHLIEGLAERHAISLLSFQEPGQSPLDDTGAREWRPLGTLCQRVVTVPITARGAMQRALGMVRTSQPDMAMRLCSRPYAARLEHWLSEEAFDVVHIEGIEMAPYLSIVERAHRRPLTIYDAHNAEYVLQRRAFEIDSRIPSRWHAAAYSYVQWRRLRRFEAEVCRRSDRVVAVSATDRAALESLVPGLGACVVPNCIDTQAYAGFSAGAEVPAFTLLFSGKMDFRPNVDAALWFAREIWPRVKAQNPTATWGIVGKSPHRRLGPLRDDPSITLLGEVPDVVPFLRAAGIYVIPLRMGGGTRFKLLEAMAAGVPVVSTTVGAEGVPARTERELLVADEPDRFADAVLRLLHDRSLQERLTAAALSLVRERFDWRMVVPTLEQVYQL